MRIYNGTNSLVTLPITGTQQITISPKSVSIDFMGGTDFISMLVTSFDPKEVALVVSGPYELSVCATVPTAVNYVVQTLDEAIQRFAIPTEKGANVDDSKKVEKHDDRDDDPKKDKESDDAPKVEKTQDNAPKVEEEKPKEETPVVEPTDEEKLAAEEEKPTEVVDETAETAPKTTKQRSRRKSKKEDSVDSEEGK